MTAPPPAHLCLTCRALFDGERCDCDDQARVLLSADGADALIEQRLLRVPKLDEVEIFGQFAVSTSFALGVLSIVFLAAGGFAGLVFPELIEDWPFVFGVPGALLAALWIAFWAWNSFGDRTPAWSAASPPATPRGESWSGQLAAGAVVYAVEIRPANASGYRQLRDAWCGQPLVLVRPGQRIEIPAGRLWVYAPDDAWEPGVRPEPLRGGWPGVPDDLQAAGVPHGLTIDGAQVTLVGGALEHVEGAESSFREAVERRYRWVGDRPCLRLR